MNLILALVEKFKLLKVPHREFIVKIAAVEYFAHEVSAIKSKRDSPPREISATKVR